MELPHELVELFRFRRTPMPFVHVLGKRRAAIALDRVADDDADAVALGGRGKRLLERFEVVAVGLDDIAPERAETLPGILDRQAPPLRMVVVVEHSQVVELEIGGDHDRLPHRALVRFAVPDQRVDVARFAGDLGGKRHAHRQADAMTKRAGRGLDAGNLGAVGMATELRIECPEGVHVLEIEISVPGEHAIETERRVTFAQHEQVAIRQVGALGIVPHGLVDRAQHLHDRKRGRDMTMPALVRDGQYLRAYLLAELVHCRTTYDTRAAIGRRSILRSARLKTSRSATVSPGKMSSASSSNTRTLPLNRCGLMASSAILVGW